MSDNGRLLVEMIQWQELSVLNNSSKCTGGPITIKRIFNGREEISCIDFILASQEGLPIVSTMYLLTAINALILVTTEATS